MAITADQRKEILGIADTLRDVLRRMNAVGQYGNGDVLQISSVAYSRVDHGLSDVLAVLTEGKANDRLLDWLSNNPDESAEWCIQRWRSESIDWDVTHG